MNDHKKHSPMNIKKVECKKFSYKVLFPQEEKITSSMSTYYYNTNLPLLNMI